MCSTLKFTRKLDETVRFYRGRAGFRERAAAAFDFPGAWLYSEGHPVLHLNDISPTDTQPTAQFRRHRPRRVRQPRLRCDEAASLASKGIPFRDQPGTEQLRRWQIILERPEQRIDRARLRASPPDRRRLESGPSRHRQTAARHAAGTHLLQSRANGRLRNGAIASMSCKKDEAGKRQHEHVALRRWIPRWHSSPHLLEASTPSATISMRMLRARSISVSMMVVEYDRCRWHR